MKSAGLAGEALTNELGVLVDQHGHVSKFLGTRDGKAGFSPLYKDRPGMSADIDTTLREFSLVAPRLRPDFPSLVSIQTILDRRPFQGGICPRAGRARPNKRHVADVRAFLALLAAPLGRGSAWRQDGQQDLGLATGQRVEKRKDLVDLVIAQL